MTDAALKFYRLRTRLDKDSRRLQRLFWSVVAVDRHVSHNQRTLYPAGNRASMMHHLVEHHLRGVFVTQYNHSDRIADQDDVEAAFIEQTRRRIIVSSQRGDAFSASLHFPIFFCQVHKSNFRGSTFARPVRARLAVRASHSSGLTNLPCICQANYFTLLR